MWAILLMSYIVNRRHKVDLHSHDKLRKPAAELYNNH